ncbi:MAG: leucine-rich repeat domain-containing protein, partial [Clostridia bacterium]|nr:leucine-rich repeat domain-containing protein [Clostridia bacterium]
MKKLLLVILGAAALACGAAGLAACKKRTPAVTTPPDPVYVSVTNASINADGELILTYSDGTSQNLGKVKGENGSNGNDGSNGQNGNDGKGISSAVINSGGELVITYTDGTIQYLGKVRGEDGEDGKDGVSITCEHPVYSDWQTEIAAGCTSVGVSLRECLTCGRTDYKFTPANGHDWSGDEFEIITATCAQTGVKVVGCANCDASNTVTAPTLSHSYANGLCTICGGNEHSEYFSYTLNGDGTGYVFKMTGDKTKAEGVVHIPAVHDGLPVTDIPSHTFWGYHNVTGVVVPDSVHTITRNPFANCNSLESIIVEDGNKTYRSDGNCVVETDTKTLIVGCKNSVIPNDGSIAKIGEYAFEYCNITSVVIPEGVTEIGNDAFKDCAELTSVHLPESLSVIGDDAFYRCYKLASVNFPQNLLKIGESSFYECEEITSVKLPDTLKEIGASAFLRCSKLAVIILPDDLQYIGEAAFSSTAWHYDHLQERVKYIGKHLIYVYWELTEYEIQYGTLTIAEGAFEQASKIERVTIPNSVVTICKGAFYNCNYLQSVTIPESVVTIGDFAFFDCDALESVTISNGVKNIGNYAFASCDRLKSVIIPDSVTTIGNYSFIYNRLNTVVIGTGVETIGYGAFSQSLTTERAVEFKITEGWVRYTPAVGELSVPVETLKDFSAASDLLNETYEVDGETNHYRWYKT